METQLSRAEKLDRLFGTPAFAVIIAILCNAMWGSAFPFIKLGYRLFAIDTADTASILCFAGVRFMLGAVLGGRLEHWSVLSVLDLLALAFICGAGYIVWALLMKNNPVSRIAIFGFVNPVVNVLLSALINGEPLFRWQYLGALVLVCIGIWLVNKTPAKKERPL